MENNVNLTDDELALIQTSLMMTIGGIKKHIEKHGKESLDIQTLEARKGMEILLKKLESI